MAASADQLPALLSRSLKPVYLVAGAEALLVQECRDQIIEAARKQGFVERDVYQVDGKFDWDSIAADSAALSLFSAQKIVDIRLPAGKPGRDGAKVLGEMASSPDLLWPVERRIAENEVGRYACQTGRAGRNLAGQAKRIAELDPQAHVESGPGS